MSAEFLPPDAVAALTDMGVPADVVQHLKTTRGMSKWGYACAVILLLSLMFGLGAVPLVAMLQLPWARWLMTAGFYPRDVILIDLQLFTVMGFMLAAAIFSLVPFSAIMLLHHGVAVRSAITGIQESIKTPQNRWLVRMILRRVFQRMAADAPLEDYLVGYHWATIRVSLKVALWIALPTAALVCWEAVSASYATPKGIRPAGMFSSQQQIIPWEQIEKLSTGSFGSGPKESAMPVYQLHYAGSSRDLAQWRVPTGGYNLSAIAQIDEQLRQRNVPWSVALYEYGIYKGQRRWDDVAFEKIRARLTPDERALFDRVYRYEP